MTTDESINSKSTHPATSVPCLLTSKTIHVMAIPVTYRDITTTLSSTLIKFLEQLRSYPSLGKYIRSLDLSPTCTALSAVSQPESELCADSLLGALQLTPLLRDFKINAIIQDSLDQTVLWQLFCKLPHLESIDLLNCNSPSLTWEFAQLCALPDFQASTSITSLNLHECSDLPSHIFSEILPQLPRLQTLDVAHTQITTEALSSIPSTARITHLNLSDCDLLSGETLTHFLRSHTATSSTMVSLNLESSANKIPFLSEDDVSSILSHAPPTLRVLNLKNSMMTTTHIPLLRRLAPQLEELTLGSNLRMRDLEAAFLAAEDSSENDRALDEDEEGAEQLLPTESKYATVLDPMAIAVAICKIRQRISSVPVSSYASSAPMLKRLDISGMGLEQQEKIRMSILLGAQSGGLEVIEISEKVPGRVSNLKRICTAVGWDMEYVGSRCILVRQVVK